LIEECRLRPEVLPAVIEKTFGSTRASLKLKAFELIMLWVEVEGTAEGVVVSFSLFLSYPTAPKVRERKLIRFELRDGLDKLRAT